ncbi:hypothetical protein ABZ707_07970 [Streptomyces sp. NPDC006923]|uniref:hypothetical protein n=1 Tax=Streptomyces sp. NPDC006923 TaxID=3155355 RepID=UPI0033F63974
MTARAHSTAIGHDLINRPTQLTVSMALISLVRGPMAVFAANGRGLIRCPADLVPALPAPGVIADDAHDHWAPAGFA